MSNEAAKADNRRKNTWLYNKVFTGHGIDIGCGSDILNQNNIYPNILSIKGFDIADGDAQYIDKYVDSEYDFVHSSQCLEHMHNPYVALHNWWKLVKKGGYIVVSIPDEDLYEQGHFPSIYNHDHKWTFSINKQNSWSNKHINILHLVDTLSDSSIIKIELVDTNYDYSIKNIDQTRGDAEAFIEFILHKKHYQ